MRRLLCLTFVLFTAVAQASVPPDSINLFIDAQMPVSGAPGLAYAVVDQGEFYAGERGEVLLGSGRQVAAETPFRLGSISKSFTALAVMQLVEAGKVDLDAGIGTYLPPFENQPSGAITIRQFLSHTSGYSTLQGNKAFLVDGDDLTRLRVVDKIAHWSPAHEPGAVFDYSNANYLVLGALIEMVSGRNYGDYIKEEIFDPIGMTHSFVADGKLHEAEAVGHRPWFGGKRPFDEPASRVTAPAGGVIASASDVALYLALMMNGESDVISAESKAEMMRPASEASPYYGFGWSLSGDGTVLHTGTSPGTETLAIMVPAERKGAVVLVNAGSGMGFGETADLLYGLSAKALDIDYAGYQGRLSRQVLFVCLALAPVLFLAGIVIALVGRNGLRSKSGFAGAFSLWFPLAMTLALACSALYLIPRLFGVSMATLGRYSPDLALTLILAAVTGVLWAAVRLGVFYTGRSAAN